METSNPLVTAAGAIELNAKGYPETLPSGVPHYDYANQCWIDAAGLVAACGHVGADPVCYACHAAGKAHQCAGECA